MGGDERGEIRRCGEGGVDLGCEARAAVVDPGEVELQRVAAAAALEGQVREVVDLSSAGGVATVEEVVGGEGVRGVEVAHVGAEEEGAGQGHAHHFVRVDGYGGREVAAVEFVFVRGGEDRGSAPGGVDVQPYVVLFADFGEGRDRVVGAEDGGAGRGVEVEGRVAFLFCGFDEG